MCKLRQMETIHIRQLPPHQGAHWWTCKLRPSEITHKTATPLIRGHISGHVFKLRPMETIHIRQLPSSSGGTLVDAWIKANANYTNGPPYPRAHWWTCYFRPMHGIQLPPSSGAHWWTCDLRPMETIHIRQLPPSTGGTLVDVWIEAN